MLADLEQKWGMTLLERSKSGVCKKEKLWNQMTVFHNITDDGSLNGYPNEGEAVDEQEALKKWSTKTKVR